MKKITRRIFLGSCALLSLTVLSGCGDAFSQRGRTGNAVAGGERVVVYCSVDEVYAKPILKKLEEQTNLKIDAVYDTEAAKTAGLANRIRAEKARPQGDVFWSSALLQTLLLEQEGLTEQYISPAARYIPPEYKSGDAQWNALGVRSRVLVYHRGAKNPPKTLHDLTKPEFKGKVGISNPMFGTASDEAAALAVRWGEARTLNWFRALKNNGARVLPGNAVVAEKVARGELLAGVTDTDDLYAQWKQGRTDIVAAPDSTELVRIPINVALLKNAPHKLAAMKLIDAILRGGTEALLVKEMRGVQSVREENNVAEMNTPQSQQFLFSTKDNLNDADEWAAAWQKIKKPLGDIVLK